jgi:hypothetical protein
MQYCFPQPIAAHVEGCVRRTGLVDHDFLVRVTRAFCQGVRVKQLVDKRLHNLGCLASVLESEWRPGNPPGKVS